MHIFGLAGMEAAGGGRRESSRLLEAADTVSYACAAALLVLMLVGFLMESGGTALAVAGEGSAHAAANGRLRRPCEEIYVVREGETLHTISDKCDDPFIVERNPHIHDPDDVFPGLVIRIVPMHRRQ